MNSPPLRAIFTVEAPVRRETGRNPACDSPAVEIEPGLPLDRGGCGQIEDRPRASLGNISVGPYLDYRRCRSAGAWRRGPRLDRFRAARSEPSRGGPKHERERGVRRHDRLGRKGHDQQYDSDARMRRPRQSGRKQNVDQRVGRDRTEQHPQGRICPSLRRERWPKELAAVPALPHIERTFTFASWISLVVQTSSGEPPSESAD